MKQLITYLLSAIALFSCVSNIKNRVPEQINTNNLEKGYYAFINDTTRHNDSLATAQAIYLVDNNSSIMIAEFAPGIKQWLLHKGIDIDTIYKKKAEALAKQEQKENEVREAVSKMPGNTDDAYEKLHIVFEGTPAIETIKPLMDAVMTRYHYVLNDDNVLKCANVLVVYKNESKVGVTEMDMLKHIYQRGSSSVDYVTQAAISSLYLEKTK